MKEETKLTQEEKHQILEWQLSLVLGRKFKLKRQNKAF
jgi:hypothetical protein